MALPQFNTQTAVYSFTRTELLSLRTKTSLLSLFTVVVVELPQAPEDDPQKR